jgi:hypothetical protein
MCYLMRAAKAKKKMEGRPGMQSCTVQNPREREMQKDGALAKMGLQSGFWLGWGAPSHL